MKHRHSAALVLAAIFLAGCAVGPDYKKPKLDSPTKYSEATAQQAADEKLLQEWWKGFGDATLDSLIDRAVKSNLDVQTAEARIREARFQRGISKSAWGPQVDLNASESRARRSENVGVPSRHSGSSGSSGTGTTVKTPEPSYYTTNWQTSMDATWELDFWGGTRRAVEAAKYDIESQIESRRAILVSLTGEVAANYVSLRGLQAQIAKTRKNIATQEDTLRLTETRLKAGLASELDASRSRGLVFSSRAELPPLQQGVDEAIHRIGVLLGSDPGSLVDELSNEAPIPVMANPFAIGVPADLLDRRPDVAQAERNLAAAVARIGQAKSDWFPKFSFVGSLGLSADDLGNIAENDSRFFSFGPRMTWPILDWGRIKNNIKVQTARQQQRFLEYKQTVLLAYEETDNALSRYQQAQERARALTEAVAAYERSVQLASQLYTNGLADFLDVLEAQRQLLTVERQLAESQANVSAGLVAVYKSLGGGWATAPEQTIDPETLKGGIEEGAK